MTMADELVELTPYAAELRRARTRAGLTQAELAEKIMFSTALVSMVEQCRRVPSLPFTRRCDELLQTDGLLERIRGYTLNAQTLPWFAHWISVEREAVDLRSFQPLIVPGLLQAEEYARAVYQGSGQFTGDELEHLVAARVDRQEIFARPRPPRCVFVVDEYVLRRVVGGPKVMLAQLEHLVAMLDQRTFRLQVVPAAAGAYTGLDGAFTIASVAAVGQDVAYL